MANPSAPVWPFDEGDELWFDVLNELWQQSVMKCTSSTRPADALRVDGMMIFETDTRKFYQCVGNGVGAAWEQMFNPITDSTLLGNGTSIDNLRFNADFSYAALPPDPATTNDWFQVVEDPSGTPVAKRLDAAEARKALRIPEVLTFAIGDETTAITTGTAKITWRMPFAMTVTGVRASLKTASSSGIPTFDINEGGTTILSTKLTIDASEKTSVTAATAAVISDTSLADDAEMTIDVDVAGTGAVGAKIAIYGYRT